MSSYLYGASVQGIQGFIFATNELKSIAGASEIVKQIEDKISKDYSDNIVINAAGNVRLTFNKDQKDTLEDLVLNFPKTIMQEAYGITISQAVVTYKEGGLKKAFEDLEAKLFIQRNKPSLPLDSSISIIKLTPKTAKPAISKGIDNSTVQKEAANTSGGNIPKNKKNKTAIVHIDGNGLGSMIASMTDRLHSDSEIIDAYRQFSINLDKATREAYELAKESYDTKQIRDIILGGDDVTIVCNADIALEFTNKFLQNFEEKTKTYLGDNGLTACAGIAYCNHKYPFHYAVNLAESLCGYAKDKSDRGASSVMFHNIQSSSFDTFDEYIDKELVLKNDQEIIRLDYGPYFLHPKDQYSTIDSFLDLSKVLMIKGTPAGRYREWLGILAQNHTQAKERMIRINDMMDIKDDLYKKSALENNLSRFNPKIRIDEWLFQRGAETYTPIGDLDTHLSVVDWSK